MPSVYPWPHAMVETPHGLGFSFPSFFLFYSCAYVGFPMQVDNLAFVWVSHKHADHMLGLAGILAARSSTAPPLLVTCPMQLT